MEESLDKMRIALLLNKHQKSLTTNPPLKRQRNTNTMADKKLAATSSSLTIRY